MMAREVIILDVCLKELRRFPLELLTDFLDATEQLRHGKKLSFPLSRPMSSIGKGVHELRLKDASGAYRAIYCYQTKRSEIYFIHAFKKKTQTTPKKNFELAKKRLRTIL